MKKKFIVLLVLLSLFVQSFFMMPVQAEDDLNWTRISGNDRYWTCIQTAYKLQSLNNYQKFDYAVVASGENFADALGGSYLACLRNAPIYVTKDTKASVINDSIRNTVNSGSTIYVLGGTAAVSEAAVADLEKDYNVVRLKGSNRYGTNIEILKEAGVTNEEIIVATGNNFADSLSASAAGKPILLVGKALNAAQKEYLSSLNTSKFYIVGGEGAVSASIEEELKAYGEVERVKGSNRFATSIEIAKKFVPDADQAVLAYSHNFPDGLCGGPLAYKMGAPILLTRTGSEQATADYTQSDGIYYGTVLGGSSLISDDAANKIFPYNRAYAVLQDNGDYVYFRSGERQSSGAGKTITDIHGNTYTGVLVAGIEEGYRTEDLNVFDEYKNKIEKVYVAQNQTVTPARLFFENAKCLKYIDLKGMNTRKLTNLSWAFSGCSSLEKIDFSGHDFPNVSLMMFMFHNCVSLKEADFSDCNAPIVTNISSLFFGCTSLRSADLTNFYTPKNKSLNAVFTSCPSLSDLKLDGLLTSNVEDMSMLFYGCSALTSLDLSHFDTSKATDMSAMFYNCSSLESVDISSFDTSSVTDMSSMFDRCASLKSVDVTHFDTSRVVDMTTMFYNCSSLESIDVSSFDTSKVVDMSFMFSNCSALKELDLSTFDTSSVTKMTAMFQWCNDLKSLNISNFNTANVNDMESFFQGSWSIDTIVLGKNMTKWTGNNGMTLPNGQWTNGTIVKTETELYEEYPSHAEEWAGTWTKA